MAHENRKLCDKPSLPFLGFYTRKVSDAKVRVKEHTPLSSARLPRLQLNQDGGSKQMPGRVRGRAERTRKTGEGSTRPPPAARPKGRGEGRADGFPMSAIPRSSDPTSLHP